MIPVSKLPDSGTTIFTVMSALAEKHQAINLSQGFPDFDGPAALRERVSWHLEHGHNQYAPLAGVTGLREAIAAKVETLYSAQVDPMTEVTVTPGATEALFCAISAVIHPGDEAIIFDPAYDTYDPCIRLNGGIAHHIPMVYPDFRIDWQRVADTVNDRTRLIMLNSPHNPSGSLLSPADIRSLTEVVEGRNIFLISDEVYEHIVFDRQIHHSLLRYPELAARTFTVSSFGKTYHATGWRIGYCIAPAPLMTEFLRIHQFINFSTNTPFQYALADFMQDSPDFPGQLGAFYQAKRDLFCELLQPSRFQFIPASGSFFQLADYSAITDEPDTVFASYLTREHGVAVIPVSVFYRQAPAQKVIRFCFAKGEDTLREAARRLRAI